MAVTYTAPTVAFSEAAGGGVEASPIERDGPDGFTATRYLLCDWSERLTLAEQLLNAYLVTQGTRVFVFGDRYPFRGRVYATRVSIAPATTRGTAGEDADGNITWSGKAMLTVDYEGLDFAGGGGDGQNSGASSGDDEVVATERFTSSAEYVRLPGQKLYKDASTTEAIDEDREAPTRLIQLVQWEYSYREQGDNLPTGIFSVAGKVNQNSVVSNTGNSFAAQTLLYQGADVNRQIFNSGNVVYEVTLKFVYKPDGWNKFYLGGEETPQILYKQDGSQFEAYQLSAFETTLGV